MSKKEVEEKPKITIDTIKEYSVKEKSVMMAQHLTSINYEGKPLFTDKEIDILVSYFKNDKEIKTYHKLGEKFNRIEVFFIVVEKIQNSYEAMLHNLDKLLLLKKDAQDFNKVTNELLELIPGDKKETALNIISTVIRTKYGDKTFQIFNQNPRNIKNQIQYVEEELVRFKTAIFVAKDALKKTGFNRVKVFAEKIRDIEEWVKGNKKLMFIKTSRKGIDKELLDDNHVFEPDYASCAIDDSLFHRFRKGYIDV